MSTGLTGSSNDADSLKIRRVSKLGKGGYSIVYKAEADRKPCNRDDSNKGHLKERPGVSGIRILGEEPNYVAVKRNIVSRKISFIATIKELDLLYRLSEHPHIVKLLQVNYGSVFNKQNNGGGRATDVTPPKNIETKDDKIHFVLECADFDLHHAVARGMLTDLHKKSIITQILLGVECIHQQKVIHRDLKPDNILLFSEKDRNTYRAKICDFGLAKNQDCRDWQSPGVVTVLYRAPEICLSLNDYNESIDIWSIGCIIYEIITGTNLIDGSGESTDIQIIDQIAAVIPGTNVKKSLHELIKRRDQQRHKFVTKKDIILDEESDADFVKVVDKTRRKRQENKWQRFQRLNSLGVVFENIVKGMLEIDPNKRVKIADILSNPFFEDQKELIERSREANLKIKARKNSLLLLKDEKSLYERQLVVALAYSILDKQSEDNYWYKPRIIYQSIDLYDRWLQYPNRDSAECLKYTSEVESIKICYYVCLYMSMKLFFSTIELPRFTDILPQYNSSEWLKYAEEWEDFFIKNVLNYKIYRNSYYENLSDKDDMTNVINYINQNKHEYKEVTFDRLFELYKLSKQIYQER